MPPRNDKPLKFKDKSSKPMLFPLHPSNMTDNRAYSRKRRRNVNPRPFLFLVGIIAVICLLVFIAMQNRVLAISVNNEVVGYIKDTNATAEEINNLVLAKLKQDVGNNIEITDNITVEATSGFFKSTDNSEQVVAKVCQAVSFNQEATSILVEGKEYCVVANVETARQALETVLKQYKCPEGTAEPEFAIQINTGTVFVDNDKVLSLDEAVKLLSATKQVDKEHTVVAGDTFATIASRAGMTESELLAANPNITDATKTNIQIGQVLKITATEPVLPIRTFGLETTTEIIDYEFETRENSSQPTSYSRVVQKGEEGEKQISKRIPYVNGEQVGEPQITEKVTKEPINKITEVGTYQGNSSNNDEEEEE